MELYKEILVNVLQRQQVRVLFPRLKISAREIVGMECYKALRKIRAILADDRLNDAECFQKSRKSSRCLIRCTSAAAAGTISADGKD